MEVNHNNDLTPIIGGASKQKNISHSNIGNVFLRQFNNKVTAIVYDYKLRKDTVISHEIRLILPEATAIGVRLSHASREKLDSRRTAQ